MSNLVTSLIRTYVPIVVGALASYLLTVGINLDADAQLGLVTALTVILQGVYYLVARLLEKKVSPRFGLLLGVASKPKY